MDEESLLTMQISEDVLIDEWNNHSDDRWNQI
jgi:hypothetical protein